MKTCLACLISVFRTELFWNRRGHESLKGYSPWKKGSTQRQLHFTLPVRFAGKKLQPHWTEAIEVRVWGCRSEWIPRGKSLERREPHNGASSFCASQKRYSGLPPKLHKNRTRLQDSWSQQRLATRMLKSLTEIPTAMFSGHFMCIIICLIFNFSSYVEEKV